MSFPNKMKKINLPELQIIFPKRVSHYFIESAPKNLADGPGSVMKVFLEELEADVFQVIAPKNYELELEGHSPANKGLMGDIFQKSKNSKKNSKKIILGLTFDLSTAMIGGVARRANCSEKRLAG